METINLRLGLQKSIRKGAQKSEGKYHHPRLEARKIRIWRLSSSIPEESKNFGLRNENCVSFSSHILAQHFLKIEMEKLKEGNYYEFATAGEYHLEELSFDGCGNTYDNYWRESTERFEGIIATLGKTNLPK
jgi:hypothetical protein